MYQQRQKLGRQLLWHKPTVPHSVLQVLLQLRSLQHDAQHKQLNGQKPIEVQGHSHLKMLDGQVVYHRDYLDIGSMLYEHIPVLGCAIKSIKKRASQ